MFKGSAPVFVVRDLAASLAFYRDALGFAVTFQYGEPTFYVCLCRDDVSLHLCLATATKRSPGESALCVFVKDVDAIHAEIVSRGALISTPIADRDYGMRDFNVRDPDGNEIVFGMGIAVTT